MHAHLHSPLNKVCAQCTLRMRSGSRLKPPRSCFWHSERPPCHWVPLPSPPPSPAPPGPVAASSPTLSSIKAEDEGLLPAAAGPPRGQRFTSEECLRERDQDGKRGESSSSTGKVGTLPCPAQCRSSTSSTARSSGSQEPSVVVARPFCDMKRSWFTRRSLTSACLKPSSSDSQR